MLNILDSVCAQRRHWPLTGDDHAERRLLRRGVTPLCLCIVSEVLQSSKSLRNMPTPLKAIITLLGIFLHGITECTIYISKEI